MKTKKYTATRCNHPDDMESREFDRKADGVKWIKRCLHGRLRRQSGDRPIVFSKGY